MELGKKVHEHKEVESFDKEKHHALAKKSLQTYNENVIVVLNNGAPVVMPFKDRVKGIVEGYLLGQVGGAAVAEMLYGVTNPSGKLTETFPERLEDTPSFLNFPGEGYKVEYREGIFVGYRHYDTKKIKPQFYFGHGLSYTEFSYDNICVDKQTMDDKEKVIVTVEITNRGTCTGKEVVQLYIHDTAKRSWMN